MRFLFLLGSYLPHASANGVCVEKIAQALIAQGHDVSCLAMARYDESSYSEIDGVKVYRIKSLWHNRVCDWCDRHQSFRYVNIVRQIALWSWRIRRLIAFPLWPLSAPLFAWKVYHKAEQIYIKEKIDCVIGVYQPIESMFVLLKLHNKFINIKTAMYMCDSLSDGVFTKIFPRKFVQHRAQQYEQKVANTANFIFCLPFVKNSIIKNHLIDINKIIEVDIPYVTMYGRLHDVLMHRDKLYFVYAGILNVSLRNPSYAIETIRRIKIKSALCFYGHTDTTSYFNASQTQSEHVDIKYYGAIDYEKCQEQLLNADILINISNRNTIQVPSKIFEYMSLGKPLITFFSDIDDHSLKYLKKYPLSLLIYEDWNKIEENVMLIEAFIRESAGKHMPFETVKSLFPRNTPEYTAKKLVELCGEVWRDE